MKRESTAQLRNARMSPRRTRLLVDMIRGMKADEALLQLSFSEKRIAGPLFKLLQSAVANAVHNHQMDKSTLVVSGGFVDGGPTTHRWMPKAFGSAGKIRKRTSHVTLILSGEAGEDGVSATTAVDAPEQSVSKTKAQKPRAAVRRTKKPANA
jgi:large subunit ribosomal protein L22